MSDAQNKDKPVIGIESEKSTRPSATTPSNPKRMWILLAALIGVGAGLGLASSLLREQSPRPQAAAQQEDLFPSAKVYRKGNLNGIPMAIRGDYLGFPMSYADKSPWEPASSPDYYKKKTYADAISSFSVVVHWPSMEPHKPANHASWLTYRTSRPTEWISIAAVGDLKPDHRPPFTAYNRLARNIKGDMNRVVQRPQKRTGLDGQLTPTELRYELLGLNPALGLQMAKTIGRDADRPGGGNYTLYWRGDLEHIVETSITCPAGTLPNPASVHTCTHEFEMLELGAYVSVYYTENLLPQWQRIETRAREFILSLRVDPKNPTNR